MAVNIFWTYHIFIIQYCCIFLEQNLSFCIKWRSKFFRLKIFNVNHIHFFFIVLHTNLYLDCMYTVLKSFFFISNFSFIFIIATKFLMKNINFLQVCQLGDLKKYEPFPFKKKSSFLLYPNCKSMHKKVNFTFFQKFKTQPSLPNRW